MVKHRFLGILLALASCVPAYHYDVTPDVFFALPHGFRVSEKKIALLVVHRNEGSTTLRPDDERTVGQPIITTTKELRQSSRRFRTNSLQFRSPVGILFGDTKQVEELCVIGDDGDVVSLRRGETEKRLSNEWREKSFGKLIEPGRRYLMTMLADQDRRVVLPPEVLSACSLGSRKAEIHWSEDDRETLKEFLAGMPGAAPRTPQ